MLQTPSSARVYNAPHTQQVTASNNEFWKACSFAVLFSNGTFQGGKKECPKVWSRKPRLKSVVKENNVQTVEKMYSNHWFSAGEK
jgi:hypothetical protein